MVTPMIRPRNFLELGPSHRNDLPIWCPHHMVVSISGGTPKSSIFMGFSLINHPAMGAPPWRAGPPHINHHGFEALGTPATFWTYGARRSLEFWDPSARRAHGATAPLAARAAGALGRGSPGQSAGAGRRRWKSTGKRWEEGEDVSETTLW